MISRPTQHTYAVPDALVVHRRLRRSHAVWSRSSVATLFRQQPRAEAGKHTVRLLPAPFSMRGGKGAKRCRISAEREGFEPSVRLPAHMISNHAPSATRSPLQAGPTAALGSGAATMSAGRARAGCGGHRE